MSKPSQFRARERAFWSKFCKVYWENKPLLIKRPASSLLEIDSDYLFTLLVRYSDYCRKTRTAQGLKLYLDGKLQYVGQVLQFLPEKDDENLLGYHARMCKWFPDYCLVCDELIQVSWEKWGLLGNFVQDLYKHVGIPNRYTEMGLYLGNYRKTPFGVHADGCGVLSVPVMGTKRFRLWDADFIKKHPVLAEAHEYNSYKKKSRLLVVRPGEISYWPSSYWHIAESDSSFTATWSIGMWVDQPYSEAVLSLVKPRLLDKLGEDRDTRTIKFKNLRRKDGYVERLPKILNRTISRLKPTLKSKWKDRFLKVWLKKISRNGFNSGLMPRATTKLRPDDFIQGKAGHPVLWTTLGNENLCIAVSGTLIELPHSAEVKKLIQALNLAKPILVKDLSKTCLKLVQRLHQLSGIEKHECLSTSPTDP